MNILEKTFYFFSDVETDFLLHFFLPSGDKSSVTAPVI